MKRFLKIKMSFKMKNIFFLIVAITLFSCSSANYLFENQINNSGFDFTKSKWLLNEIDAPKSVKKELTDIVIANFTAKSNSRFSYLLNENNILVYSKVEMNPSKSIIMDLKKGTDFDYFINIKAKIIQNDFDNKLDLTHHNSNKNMKNIVSVQMEVYDLNLLETIYSQIVTGTTTISEDNNSDVNLIKSNDKLIIGCYKKMIKSITKKSIQ
jgi:hypothetical protein